MQSQIDADEKKFIEEYQNLVHLFETIPHIDNMKVLKALINPKDDPQPLVDGITKRRVWSFLTFILSIVKKFPK